MTVQDLLTSLRECGIELTVDGDTLRYRAPQGVLTDDLRQALRAHKGELMALLAQKADDWQAERAAIYEYDGRMSRAAAEALAAHGPVVGLPACPLCNGMTYQYADGYIRCTTPWCQQGRDTSS